MLDRYEYINAELAESLICHSYNLNPLETDDTINKYYNIKNYVIVHKKNIPLADDSTPPTAEYYHDVMQSLMKLYENGVFIQPILGYSVNENTIKSTNESTDVQGAGYVILAKQSGEPLYSYKKMPNPFNLNSQIQDTKKNRYLLDRIEEISKIPQNHFNKLANDLHKTLDAGLNFNYFNQSNIIYNSQKGFILTNINNKLSPFRLQTDFEKCFIRNCLAVCAVSFEFSNGLSATEKSQIKNLNTEIFNKCINAIKQFDIDDKLIKSETNNIWKN